MVYLVGYLPKIAVSPSCIRSFPFFQGQYDKNAAMPYLAVKYGIFDLKMVPHAFFYMRNVDIIKS